MLNPGYVWRFSKDNFRHLIEPGTKIFCPHCKKPLMETNAERVYQRCKHCRRWIYLEKQR